jgi:hypothetical protein
MFIYAAQQIGHLGKKATHKPRTTGGMDRIGPFTLWCMVVWSGQGSGMQSQDGEAAPMLSIPCEEDLLAIDITTPCGFDSTRLIVKTNVW